jgi:hypothetical protein
MTFAACGGSSDVQFPDWSMLSTAVLYAIFIRAPVVTKCAGHERSEPVYGE